MSTPEREALVELVRLQDLREEAAALLLVPNADHPIVCTDRQRMQAEHETAVPAAWARARELAAQQEAAPAAPVAWMHDGENRLDICHATIKQLLIDAKCGKQVEHYTIPLYAAPLSHGGLTEEQIRKLMQVAHAWADEPYPKEHGRTDRLEIALRAALQAGRNQGEQHVNS